MPSNSREEIACDEAELEPDELAEKMHFQHKLQEQVDFSPGYSELYLLKHWILRYKRQFLAAIRDAKAYAQISPR